MQFPSYWSEYFKETTVLDQWSLDDDGETLTTPYYTMKGQDHILVMNITEDQEVSITCSRTNSSFLKDKDGVLISSNPIVTTLYASLSPYTLTVAFSSGANPGSHLQATVSGLIVPPLFDGDFLPLDEFKGEESPLPQLIPDRWVDIVSYDPWGRLTRHSSDQYLEYYTTKSGTNEVDLSVTVDMPDVMFTVYSRYNTAFTLTDKDGVVLLHKVWGDSDSTTNIPLLAEKSPYSIRSNQTSGANNTYRHRIFGFNFPYQVGDVVLPYPQRDIGSPFGMPSVVPFENTFTTTVGTGIKNESGGARYLFQQYNFISNNQVKYLINEKLQELCLMQLSNGELTITDLLTGGVESVATDELGLSISFVNSKLVFSAENGDVVFPSKIPYKGNYLVIAIKVNDGETLESNGLFSIDEKWRAPYKKPIESNNSGHVSKAKRVVGMDKLHNTTTGKLIKTGVINGTVKEQGIPVAKAVLLFRDNGIFLDVTKSDKNGDFQFIDLPMSWKYMIVSKEINSLNQEPTFHPDAVGFISPKEI